MVVSEREEQVEGYVVGSENREKYVYSCLVSDDMWGMSGEAVSIEGIILDRWLKLTTNMLK